MRKFMIIASLLVGFTGCGKKDKFDEVLGEMDGYKSKMCACTDKACTEKVQDEWRGYRKTMKDKLGKDAKPSEAQDKRGRAIDDELRACRKKYDSEGSAATPPPAAPEAPPATPPTP